jgi:MFS family permease
MTQDTSEDTRQDTSEDRDVRRNHAVLLGQGACDSAADQLTSVQLVLPFLYATAGAPVFFAGLLVPVSTIAKRLAQLLSAPLVSATRSNKRLIALSALALAAAIVLISLTFNAAGVYLLVPIFLVVALIIGAANGLGSLAFQDMIGRILPKERRSRLLFTQSSLAGLIVVIVAFGAQVIFRPGTSLAAHQELIWLGIGLFVLSAIGVMLVREPERRQPSGGQGDRDARGHRGQIATLRDSFRMAFALPWFGRFLVARTLYLSIELAIPFFSIHAASFHGNSISGLNAFVIAANVGLIAGGFLWARLGKRSVNRVLVLAAGLTCVGGLLAIAVELGFMAQSILCYAIVFVLVSLGAQGIKNGRTLYLLDVATDEERLFCLAVANVTIGMAAFAFGGLLGALAGYKGVAWVIVVLVVLNVAAALYTLRLRAAPAEAA